MTIKILPLVLSILCVAVHAAEPSANQRKTVAEAYPRLAIGALTFAKVAELPEDVVLRAGRVELRIDTVNRVVANQPPQLQEDLKKNAYLIVEQQATRDILLQLARQDRPAEGPQDAEQQDIALIQAYLEKRVLSTVEVTEAEVKQLYEAQKSMFGGATLDQMYASIKKYLLDQKKQEAVTEFIRNLGKNTDITVSNSWLKKQAVLARDNPVDKARDSGRPSLVDFGATGCGPCDMMAPILETLTDKYKGKLNVLFVHVRERQILAAKYAIQTIPVQAFFDKEGNEVFRHVGFFAQEEIEKRLMEMGVAP
jgi:thiol-disulfide isomerase/thioredoxin